MKGENMRKLLLIMLLVVGSLQAAIAQERMPNPPLLVVHGQAEERVAPDTATVRVGVVARGATAAAAQDEVNEIMARLLQRVTALGIDRKDIQTSNLMLNPVYAGGNQPNEQVRIVGYEARNQVSITVNNLTLIGKVIDASVAAGSNNIEGVFFGLRDDKEARLTALRNAVANAREKATAMASALGVDLVSVHEIVEGGGFVQPVAMYDMAMARGAEKAGASVEPGQVNVNATVTIRYVIRQR